MAYTSVYKGIIFIEGYEPTARVLSPITFEKSFTFNSQSQTLDCVKDQFVEKTLRLGGNAVVNFQYGQKTAGWFKSMLCSCDDDVRWHGNGMAAILPEEKIQEIFGKLNNF